MKLKRLENGAYCFLVVVDPQQEEVRLGAIDPGTINPDELILVPKSTLAGLLSGQHSATATNAIDSQDKPTATPTLPAEPSGVRAVEQAPTITQPPPRTSVIQDKPRRDYRPGDLLSRKEAAEYLGVSQQTLAVWKCTARYPLPCIKIGRLVKYKKCELDEFVEKLRAGADKRKR